MTKRNLGELPEGWMGGDEDDDGTWIEHHDRDGKRITVCLSPLSKAAVDEGFTLISKAYNLHTDGHLTPAGYDLYVDRKYINRFKTQAAASQVAEELKEAVV